MTPGGVRSPIDSVPMLEMQGICKRYGSVRANENVTLSVERAQIFGLLGENGSGKSTLMKILFGMVRADAGTIQFNGQALSGHSPRAAIRAGIAMIHQHFMLVEAMTVAENIMLGWKKAGAWLQEREVAKQIRLTSHFITHKLAEVFQVCEEVTVLRNGKNAGRCRTLQTTRNELASMMVGREFGSAPPRVEIVSGAEVLEVNRITLEDSSGFKRLDEVTFSVRQGEILALAGVDGNGQTELVEVLAGLQTPTSGRIALDGRDISKKGVTDRLRAGIAYIPVDRSTTSLVLGMTVADNLALRDFAEPPWRRGLWLNHPAFHSQAISRISEFGIRGDGPKATVNTLSGGNQQKIVIAREIGRKPRVLVAFQATWGLDPGATRFVIDQIIELRNSGGAVLYLSSDLEELLGIGDRIGVIADGRLVGIVARDKADPAEIGLLMAGGGSLPTTPDRSFS
jgi:ABC-type uncharacterized transport system ATPase subunit